MRTSAPRPSLPAPMPVGDDDDGMQVDALVDAVVEPVFHDDSMVARSDSAANADVGSHDRRSFVPPGVDPLQRTSAVGSTFAPTGPASPTPTNSTFPTAYDPTPAFVEAARAAAPRPSETPAQPVPARPATPLELGRTVAAYAAMRDR